MPVASGKNKTTIAHLLNVGSQQRLHVILWIIAYLLEFVYGYDARLVCIFQKTENFFECCLRPAYITKFEVKCRDSGDRVISETTIQRLQHPDKQVHHLFPLRSQTGVYLLAQQHHKFRQTG